MIKYYFLLIVITITILGCEKNNNNLSVELRNKLDTNLTILHDAAVTYNDVFEQSGDFNAAFLAMKNLLVDHPDVSTGWFHNREYLEVEFINGLKSSINIIPVAANGEHISRGGGSGDLTAFRMRDIQSQEIKNKKVLMMIPYPDKFKYTSTELQNLEASFTAGDPDMEVDMQIGSDIDLSDLNKLGDYGLIILDVHGRKNGFSLIYLDEESSPSENWSSEDVITDAIDVYGIPPEKIANGEIEIGIQFYRRNDNSKFRFDLNITENYIRQLNIDLSDAVLFGNHCYSGHTAEGSTRNNMPEAWKSKGLATYYGYASLDGYSAPVLNTFCKQMEIELISGLVADGDTTGEAHLDSVGIKYSYLPSKGYNRIVTLYSLPIPPDSIAAWSLYFRQYFDKDYEYEKCGDDIVDTRDGHTYKTVCIGDQVWMAENLNYDAPGSYCYDNDNSKCNEYGRLYPYSSMVGNILTDVSNEIPSGIRGICPEGWHIPSYSEWSILFNQVGGFAVAGDKLKSTNGWISNGGGSDDYNFTAKPGGQSFESSNQPLIFSKITERASFWTCSHFNNPVGYTIASFSLVTGQVSGVSTSSWADATDGTSAISCRCLKD